MGGFYNRAWGGGEEPAYGTKKFMQFMKTFYFSTKKIKFSKNILPTGIRRTNCTNKNEMNSGQRTSVSAQTI